MTDGNVLLQLGTVYYSISNKFGEVFKYEKHIWEDKREDFDRRASNNVFKSVIAAYSRYCREMFARSLMQAVTAKIMHPEGSPDSWYENDEFKKRHDSMRSHMSFIRDYVSLPIGTEFTILDNKISLRCQKGEHEMILTEGKDNPELLYHLLMNWNNISITDINYKKGNENAERD